jgi:hypothetical protein
MIVFVADPVATAICCMKSMGRCVVDKHIMWKIGGIETLSQSTLGPTRIDAICISQALAPTNVARMLGCAFSLTAVILSIPLTTSSWMKAETVIVTTFKNTCAISITVAITLSFKTHIQMVFVAAVMSATAIHGQLGNTFNTDKYLLAYPARQGVL